MYANILKHSKMENKSIHVCIWHQLENYGWYTMWLCGCFLKWWYSQNTPKIIIFSRKTKPMVVGETHHFRKPPCTFYITFTPVSAACLWVSDPQGVSFCQATNSPSWPQLVQRSKPELAQRPPRNVTRNDTRRLKVWWFSKANLRLS